MKKCFLLLLFLNAIVIAASAQYSRFIVIFKDKKGTPFTLSNPSAYLSSESIARRNRAKITMDSTDLPVTPAYLDSLSTVPNVTILNTSKWLNQVSVRTTDPSALARINRFSFVKSTVAIGLRTEAAGVPSSKYIERSSGTDLAATINTGTSVNYGNSFQQIHLHNGEYLHNLGFTGAGLTIAILDAGFQGYKFNPMFDSVRLQNRVLGEWDFVAREQSVNEDDAHGMNCFSIMAANRPGLMVGSAPRAGYYLFRTEDAGSEYPVEEQNWAAGAERADSAGAFMISSSLGYSDFDDPSFDHSLAQRDGNTTIVTRAADLAAKKGMIVMNSAGNSGTSAGDLKYVDCPADGDSVVAVGAVDVNGNIAGFSSWGPNGAGKLKPNIVSVGLGTTIAGLNGNPTTGSGTSFANPNIAGLIACLWQAYPEFANMDIIDAVQRSADRFSTPDTRFGYGIPDFKKAFAILLVKSFQGTVTNANCVSSLNWTGKAAGGMQFEIKRKAGFDTGFVTIARVNSRSAAFQLNTYSFNDTISYIAPTTVEYRVQEVLPDTTVLLLAGTANITDVCNPAKGFIVTPNPFNSSISLVINTPDAIPDMSVALYGVNGQLLYYKEAAKTNGRLSLMIPTAGLSSGTYVIMVRDKTKTVFSKKILKRD